MGKTLETKKKIYRLLTKGTKTPGEISDELGLAPSTVSEHIEDLERMGAVNQIDNPFIKKWKYYRANPNFEIQRMAEIRRAIGIPQIAGALVILLALLGLAVFGIPALSAGGVGAPLVFSITDPPSVPSGTQALNVTYSSLQAHYIAADNVSGWISGTGSGTLDLMSLINTSEVIGTGRIPANSTIDMVRFSITSAKITINGTTSNVTVPSGQLTAHVTGTTRSGSSVLIDLSPVVTTIFTQDTTVFVLVPSVKAVLVGNATAGVHLGERHQLTHNEDEQLNSTRPEINITSASLSVVGNTTTELRVTVKNNGKENVTLRHVLLMGMPSVLVGENSLESGNFVAETDKMPPGGLPLEFLQLNESTNSSSTAEENVSMGGNGGSFGEMMHENSNLGTGTHDNGSNGLVTGGSVGGEIWMGIGGEMEGMHKVDGIDVMARGNFSANGHGMLGLNESERLDQLVRVGEDARNFRMINFIVTANGTLVLPFVSRGIGRMMPECDNCFGNGTGFVLNPGASVTLAFSGPIAYADGHIRVTPVVGSDWRLVVQGEEGARATTEVTVS